MLLAAGLGAAHGTDGAPDLRQHVLQPLELQPVRFGAEVKDSIGMFTDIADTVSKPAGDGPLPATVLMHTWGGLEGAPWAHMKPHAQALLAGGHVVLMVDSFGPRGLDSCATRPLSHSAGIGDACAALALLAAKPFVDKSRIYQAGFSWGAFVSAHLASPQSARLVDSGLRFAATVANYGSCAFGQYQLVLPDIDRPLLLLMGGRDEEVPAAPCFPMLEQMKVAGKPVDWHVYPEASHAWDTQGLRARGYVYSAQVTQDATARMLAFFATAR
ncbi:MAG: dienelactone hydrolase family protein [Gammaproteobacteria bacterium]